MLLEPEPVAAAAPLVLAGDQPKPLDGRVALLARAADHSVLREVGGAPFNNFQADCFKFKPSLCPGRKLKGKIVTISDCCHNIAALQVIP